MVKVAVVGAGYWGKNLVRNFHSLGALRMICDASEEIRAKAKTTYPEVECADNLEAALRLPDVQGIVLATPAEKHFEHARRALEAGKHVYVEKPLALKVADGEELIKLADAKRLTLMVGHILLFHPGVIKLKEIMDAGELGKINYIYSNRLNLGKVRQEENILWSFAPHDISVIIHLLNEMPETVSAVGGNFLNQKIADVTTTHLSFKSGVKSHIFVSWLHPFKEQKLVVVGDRRMAVFDDVTPTNKLVVLDWRVEWKDRRPEARKQEGQPVAFPTLEPLRLECQHFLEAIEQGFIPKTDGRGGLNVLKILNLAQSSLENAGRPLPLGGFEGEEVFIHPTAQVDTPVSIGTGTRIWHFSHVLPHSHIGQGCNIGQNVVIGPRVTIGNNVKIQNNISVYEGVELEDDVFCGPSCIFTNVLNPRSHISRKHEFRHTLVKQGATIGAGATIVCGHTIGRHAFLAAGAVVTRNVPDYALVMGNPARIAGWMCKCGVRLSFSGEEAVCSACAAHYRNSGDEVSPI